MPRKGLHGGNIALLQGLDDDAVFRPHGREAHKGIAGSRIIGIHHPLQTHHALLDTGIQGVTHEMDADVEQNAAQQEQRRKNTKNIFMRKRNGKAHSYLPLNRTTPYGTFRAGTRPCYRTITDNKGS